MMERRRGRIVTISSVAAFKGRTNGSIYATAKAGVVHFTRCLADQMRPYDVTVNAIAPGDTRTERFLATRAVDPARLVETGTLDRIATVDEVARVVEFFAGPHGRLRVGPGHSRRRRRPGLAGLRCGAWRQIPRAFGIPLGPVQFSAQRDEPDPVAM